MSTTLAYKGGKGTVVPSYETYEASIVTLYLPILAWLLVLTVMLLDPLIVIQEGQKLPPTLQLKFGTMPQLFASVNWIAAGFM